MKIALVGSVRYKAQFEDWAAKLCLAGHRVYNLPIFSASPEEAKYKGVLVTLNKDQKNLMVLQHLEKIEECDGVVVINVNGYVGDGTRFEILWARMKNKQVYYIDVPEGQILFHDASRLLDKTFSRIFDVPGDKHD